MEGDCGPNLSSKLLRLMLRLGLTVLFSKHHSLTVCNMYFDIEYRKPSQLTYAEKLTTIKGPHGFTIVLSLDGFVI